MDKIMLARIPLNRQLGCECSLHAGNRQSADDMQHNLRFSGARVLPPCAVLYLFKVILDRGELLGCSAECMSRSMPLLFPRNDITGTDIPRSGGPGGSRNGSFASFPVCSLSNIVRTTESSTSSINRAHFVNCSLTSRKYSSLL